MSVAPRLTNCGEAPATGHGMPSMVLGRRTEFLCVLQLPPIEAVAWHRRNSTILFPKVRIT